MPDLLVVVQQAKYVILLEFTATLEEVQFDRESDAYNLSPKLTDQLYRSLHRSTRCQQIVDDQHALTRLYRVQMNLKRICAVFQVVFHLGDRGRKLLRLAHRNEAGVEAVSQGGTEDEAACLDPEHEIDLLADVIGGEGID